MRNLEGKVFEAEYRTSVYDHEIKLVNEQLEWPIEVKELNMLAQDLIHHPSKHADIISTMRQRFELHSTLTN